MILRLFFLFSIIAPALSYYSKYYRKCKLSKTGKFDLGNAKIERVPEYAADFNFTQITKTTKELEYVPLNFIYNEFIDAGGSGEVYLVEDFETGKGRVLKRFFKEKKLEFQQQNFVMSEMGYEVKWHKDDNNMNKSTMASFPSKQSIVLRDMEIENSNDIAVVFYKICRELAKAHRKGIIHDDIKMGNVLISSVGEGLRTVEVQLIDWNLASFYSKGYQSNEKKGTVCYYAPESILRTSFITPAADIWALAIVYFSFITDKKPFTVNCKVSNLQAILTLVGSERFLEVYEKYHKVSAMEVSLIEQIKANKKLYEGISLSDRIPDEFAKFFDNQLLDLFTKMLEVDPQYRLTITEVMNHPYFDRVKRLPKMYSQKNKKKNQKYEKVQQRHAPANNLVSPEFFTENNGN